jgi:3-hydroxyisobutyrate dehydrogenase-like beta-hydroxyacid dehydrogenase
MHVAVLGLGNMGGAVARCLAKAGHEVYGWSRSEETRARASAYCTPIETLDRGLVAADLIIGCLPNYDSSRALFDTGSGTAWRAKTLVQLAGGSPDEAETMAGWATEHGVAYIDGAIATFPKRVGATTTSIFFSGDRAAYAKAKPVLDALGGRNLFVSDKVSGAEAIDMAWLSLYYGVSLGLLHGVAFCEAEGLSTDIFFEAVPSFVPEIGAAASEYKQMLAAQSYRGDQATLQVHVAAMNHLASAGKRYRLDPRFMDLLLSIYGDACKMGYSQQEIVAAMSVVRGQSA